jgi:hypothetical protein
MIRNYSNADKDCVGYTIDLLLLSSELPLRFALRYTNTCMVVRHNVAFIFHLLKCTTVKHIGNGASTNPTIKLKCLQ